MKSKRLINYLKCDGFIIKRIFPKKDTKLYEELIILYNKNKDHLYYWHKKHPQLDFQKIEDYFQYLVKSKFLCYVIIDLGKIIGCIEIGYSSLDNSSFKYREITYWIDKHNAGKGIMFNTICAIEKFLRLNNTDYLLATVNDNNEPSKKLLEKLDFKFNSAILDFGDCNIYYKKFKKNLLNDKLLEDKKYEYFKTKCLRLISKCKKYKSKKLDLSRHYLTELPEEISELTWLKELDLSSCNLIKLPGWIGNISELTKLILNNNRLSILPNTINKLQNLKILEIDYNDIETLPGTFGNLSSLKVFAARNTQLIKLPKSFGKLTLLQELDLEKRFFCENPDIDIFFPKSMRNLEQLRKIRFVNFNCVPDIIGELKNITKLDLGYNKLNLLPDFVFNLTNLKELILNNTKIIELPDKIINFKKLEILNIQHSILENLPENIGSLNNLKELNLSHTEIKNLPKNIINLGNLKKLNLSYSKLKYLPNFICNLTNLKELNMHNTKIRKLPKKISALNRLKTLDLGSCELKYLPESIGNLTNLIELDLCSTKIKELPRTIKKLINLESLNIIDSKIIDPSALKKILPKLKDFYYDER